MSGQQHHDAADAAFWMQPPPNPAATSEPIWVDLSNSLFKVAAVDTVAGTAYVSVNITTYWTDPRLVGWPQGAELPARLWGPKLDLKNALGDLQETDYTFMLKDPTTGRMKRDRGYTGTLDNPMDMQNFPLDMDKIELKFATNGTYVTYDGERSGQTMANGKGYQLRQVLQEAGEGEWLRLNWSGQIGEWTLHGVSTMIDGGHFLLSFHVTRNSAYYFWKALLPLYMLTALSMATFHFETDNLSDRTSTISTYFLAAFAMLYVVGAALPKTDFLTKIDTVIVMTTVSLALTGIASLALAKVHKDMGVDAANDWNLGMEVSLISAYVLTNFWIFAPPCIQQIRGAGRLSGYTRMPLAGSASDSDEARDDDLPPTVERGCSYYTLEDVRAGDKTILTK
jgi:hypothetical protein